MCSPRHKGHEDLTVTDVSQFLGSSLPFVFRYQTSLWDTDKCLWGSRINANAVSNSSQNSFYQFGYHDLTLQQYVPVYTNPQKIPGSDERYRYVLVAKSTETITRAAYIEILQRRENPNTSTFIPVESSLYTSTDFIGNGNMTFQKVADLPIWAGSYSLDNWENMEVHRDFVRINQNSSNTTAVYYRYDGAHFSPSYATVYQRPDFAWFPGFSIPYATTSNTPDYRSMPLDARDQNGEILHRLEDYNETRISGGTNTYKLVAQLAVMKQQRSPIFHSDTKIDSYGQIVFGATDANPMLVNGNAYGMKDNLPVKIM